MWVSHGEPHYFPGSGQEAKAELRKILDSIAFDAAS